MERGKGPFFVALFKRRKGGGCFDKAIRMRRRRMGPIGALTSHSHTAEEVGKKLIALSKQPPPPPPPSTLSLFLFPPMTEET